MASGSGISGVAVVGSKLVLVHCGDAGVPVIDRCVVAVVGTLAATVTGVVGLV